MATVRSRKTAARRGRKATVDAGLELLLRASHLQNQAVLVEMARSHAEAVLQQVTELSLAGTEGAALQLGRAVAALEKAHGVLVEAELEALEGRAAE